MVGTQSEWYYIYMCYFLFLSSLYLSSNQLPSVIAKLLDRINFSNKKVPIPSGTSKIFSNDNLSKFSSFFSFFSRAPPRLSPMPMYHVSSSKSFLLWQWEPDNIEGDVFTTPWRFRYIRCASWLIIVINVWYR